MAKPACASGCGAKVEGSPEDMAPEVWERVKDHPCYNSEAHHYFARMHVGVAPACNIQCHYCNRKYDCANESRPGVVSERLSPDQAVRKVMAVAAQVPQLSVVGIAGPGDALADPERTFATCERVAHVLPDVKLCLSTNGLALPDHVTRIVALGISHVTITINAIDPEIGAQIYPWISFAGRRFTGVEGATILRDRQLLGLDMLVAAGVLVKVNSVMIPGINDQHLKEVNAEVKRRGVFLHNIMPLISDPAHGTHYGLTGQRGPTPQELKALQDELSGGAALMRHCRQCRADAVGMLGSDQSAEFTLDRIPEGESEGLSPEDVVKRKVYREIVEAERADRRQAAEAADDMVAIAAPEEKMLVAVCTQGGGRINIHFGKATEFPVYEVDSRGVRLIGHRRPRTNYCKGGYGEDDALGEIITALEGVAAVLSVKIGNRPRKRLEEAGIKTAEYPQEYIETAVAAYFRDQTEAATEDGRLTA
ncbi:MAG: nitrogenase cofactor biosynthesis protein NifB [Rhodospirillaceae bacterium]|nr:nitrogenase cofactor biosynthesis protein NifB [Rhodospirillaceae bacterium]